MEGRIPEELNAVKLGVITKSSPLTRRVQDLTDKLDQVLLFFNLNSLTQRSGVRFRKRINHEALAAWSPPRLARWYITGEAVSTLPWWWIWPAWSTHFILIISLLHHARTVSGSGSHLADIYGCVCCRITFSLSVKTNLRIST